MVHSTFHLITNIRPFFLHRSFKPSCFSFTLNEMVFPTTKIQLETNVNNDYMHCKIKCSHSGKAPLSHKTLFLLVVSFYSPDQFTSHGLCCFFSTILLYAHGIKIISVCTLITATELYCMQLNPYTWQQHFPNWNNETNIAKAEINHLSWELYDIYRFTFCWDTKKQPKLAILHFYLKPSSRRISHLVKLTTILLQ